MTKLSSSLESNKENISSTNNNNESSSSLSSSSNQNNKIMNKLNPNKRIRRTISFINTNRKRAANYCTLSKQKLTKNHRRLSLSQPKKLDSTSSNQIALIQHANSNLILTSNENLTSISSCSFKSTRNQLVQFANEFSVEKTNLNNNNNNNIKKIITSNASVSFKQFVSSKYNKSTSSNATSNSNKTTTSNSTGTNNKTMNQDLINMQSLINSDKLLKEYIDNQSNRRDQTKQQKSFQVKL